MFNNLTVNILFLIAAVIAVVILWRRRHVIISWSWTASTQAIKTVVFAVGVWVIIGWIASYFHFDPVLQVMNLIKNTGVELLQKLP